MKKKFEYGKFLIEFRTERDGLLHFLKKRVDVLEEALKEASKLRDLGYHDITIRNNH